MFNEPALTILTTIGVVHLIALISPGPDFAMIVRSCAQYGKRYAMISALGLGLGVAFHATYSLLGIKLLINAMPYVINIIAVFGSLYFFYQGYKALIFGIKIKKNENSLNVTHSNSNSLQKTNTTVWQAIGNGFLTNALNPKAFLYFFSFFAATVSNISSPYVSLIAGIEVFLLTWAWFSFLAQIVSTKKFLGILDKYSFLVNSAIGIIFILFSISMILYSFF